MFNIGDKVQCIYEKGVESELSLKNIYTIIEVNTNFIYIINDINEYGYYKPIRFKIVKEKQTKFVPMNELEVISVNGIDGILIPE